MKRVRIAVVMLVAVAALGATLASSAYANCALALGFCVNGAPLGPGQKKEITAKLKAGTEFTFDGEVLGIKVVVKCKKLKLKAAEKPVIVGGMAGTDEKEVIEFEECSATLGGTACVSVTFVSVPLSSELVRILKPAALAGKSGMLFRPSAGVEFAKEKLKECGIFGSQEAAVEGTTVALFQPELTEQILNKLIWNLSEQITEVEKTNGALSKDGLTFAGNPAQIGAEVEVELLAKEIWGIGPV